MPHFLPWLTEQAVLPSPEAASQPQTGAAVQAMWPDSSARPAGLRLTRRVPGGPVQILHQSLNSKPNQKGRL